MIARFFSGRGFAAALIGGGLVLGSVSMALAYSGSTTGRGDTRAEALDNAYRSARSICGVDEARITSRDCSRDGSRSVCVVTFSC